MLLTLLCVAAVTLTVVGFVRAYRRPLDARMYDAPMVIHLNRTYPPDENEGAA